MKAISAVCIIAILSSPTLHNAYLDWLSKNVDLALYYNDVKCANCTIASVESSCLSGKHCNKCGCAPGKFPPADVSRWAIRRIFQGDPSIPNTTA